jgi:hypothetical protein
LQADLVHTPSPPRAGGPQEPEHRRHPGHPARSPALGRDKKVVHVRVVDERRPGVVVRMRIYEIRDGKLVREG